VRAVETGNARPGWSPGRAAGWLARPTDFLNPLGWGSETCPERLFEEGLFEEDLDFEGFRAGPDSFVKGLILAQNERWRRGLGMQVERVRRKADQWRKGE
jgi:hypothetical protein